MRGRIASSLVGGLAAEKSLQRCTGARENSTYRGSADEMRVFATSSKRALRTSECASRAGSAHSRCAVTAISSPCLREKNFAANAAQGTSSARKDAKRANRRASDSRRYRIARLRAAVRSTARASFHSVFGQQRADAWSFRARNSDAVRPPFRCRAASSGVR